eukprot:scaffold20959_cov63-Phaeocystis_antarctica.AAC.2
MLGWGDWKSVSPEFVLAGGSTTALSSGGASGKSLSCPTMPSIDGRGESSSPSSAVEGCASTALGLRLGAFRPTSASAVESHAGMTPGSHASASAPVAASPSSVELVGFAVPSEFATHFFEALLAA